jgi:AraC-like DNA-binding protein
MCGIAGWVDFDRDLTSDRDRAIAEDMTRTMACRGPDDEGLWLAPHAALGNRRLAVIDVEGGRQPMTVEGLAVLTYSGEVYNFLELRSELESRGYRFRTKSDTEVVLRAYLEWGEGVVDRLNGMYAFAIYEDRRPYWLGVEPPGGTGAMRGLILSFPRTMLPLPARHLGRLTAVAMPASQGIGALTSRLLVQLATGMDHYSPAEAERLSTAALEVLATRLAHELDATGWVPPETQRRALVVRMRVFIEEHLGDPELSPGTVAAAHHVSLSYLHKLFKVEGVTVAGLIRQRRLEGSRRDLADPALARRPVAAIAARWGFTSAAHFSRVFKATYGMPPQEYRRLMQLGGADGDGASVVHGSSQALH